MTSIDSFGARGTLNVGSASYEIFRIAAVEGAAKLPFTHKVLLENLLAHRGRRQRHARHHRVVGRLGPVG